MEQDPTQPIEQRHRRLTAKQEAHARTEIEIALNRLSELEPVIDTNTARVIAACLHGGHGTLLEHFAATGRLNPRQAADELRRGLYDKEKRAWAAVLARYLSELDSPSPDRRPLSFVEPKPEAFLSPPKPGSHGQWISLAVTQRVFEESLEQLDPDWSAGKDAGLQLHRDGWTIGNTVGFHSLQIGEMRSLRTLMQLAQGISQHGEAFAAYAEAFGLEGASAMRFRQVHEGSFENMTEVVEAYAYRWGLLDPDKSPEHQRVRGPTVSPRLLERGIREHFICQQGRTQLHLFKMPDHK